MSEDTTLSTETSSVSTSSEQTITDDFRLLYTYHNMDAKLYINEKTNLVKLYRKDIELTKDILNVNNAWVYDDEFWSYRDTDGFVHLFKNETELTKNIKALGVTRHPQTGQWIYANEKNQPTLLPV